MSYAERVFNDYAGTSDYAAILAWLSSRPCLFYAQQRVRAVVFRRRSFLRLTP